MNIKDYQFNAMDTLFPACDNWVYATAGLTEEIGELCEKLDKAVGDGVAEYKPFGMYEFNKKANDVTLAQTKDAIMLELGDIAWFIALNARIFGTSFEKVDNDLAYLGSLTYHIMRLNTHVGKLNGIASKAVRKKYMNINYNNIQFTSDATINDHDDIIKASVRQLEKIMAEYKAIIIVLGFKLEDVLEANYAKLQGRKKHGTIVGNGDYR